MCKTHGKSNTMINTPRVYNRNIIYAINSSNDGSSYGNCIHNVFVVLKY